MQSFAHDGLNRLLTAARSDAGYNHTYNYDSFGNLLIQDNLNPGPSYNINSATNQLNRYSSVTNQYNAYTYDAAGNLISTGTSDIGGHTFQYNALNQITSVDAGVTAVYSYNGSDERAFKQASTAWTDYVYLEGLPVSEQSSSLVGPSTVSLTALQTAYRRLKLYVLR